MIGKQKKASVDKFIGCMSGLLKNPVMVDGFLDDSFFHE